MLLHKIQNSSKFVERLFRRETSSKEFIPVIDGLRFLAILMVVLFHVGDYLTVKTRGLDFSETSLLGNLPPHIFEYGYQGVQLFFVISGFILAIPFMRFNLGLSEKKVTLRKYFLRRLTRLEPPYIISLVIIFFLTVFIAGSNHSIGTLIISFFASLLYIHNFLTPGELPYLNSVIWSLEVEVQFYILAPLLVWIICKVEENTLRRIFTLFLIVAFSALAWYFDEFRHLKTISLASYLQYFLAGILLCDFYLLGTLTNKYENNILIFLLGFGLLVSITCFPLVKSPNLILRIASPLLIFGFYIIVFRHFWWRKIFSFNALTLVGGMCYTIYLFHYQIISAVGRVTISKIYVDNFDLFYLFQLSIYISAILLISAGYFLLVEKPCMAQDWHIKLYSKFNSKLRNKR